MNYEVVNIRNPTDSRELATKFSDANNLLFVAVFARVITNNVTVDSIYSN